jgi:hypothetical protein
MTITLTGTTFTDTLLADVGSSVFTLDHDWFTKQDLVIRTAAAGGGTLLVEGTDFTLGTEDTDLSARVTAAVGSGRNVFHTIAIINAAYETGDLYFSGKYIADSLDPLKQPSALVTAATFADMLCQTLPPFVPVGIHKGFVAALETMRCDGTTTATTTNKLVDSAADFVTDAVVAGDWIYNSTDGTWARVTARDDLHTLSVDANVFASGESYTIYPTPTWPENIKECDGSTISDAESPLNGMKLPSLNAAGSYADSTVAGGMHLRGGTTAGVTQEDQMQGHYHLLARGTGSLDDSGANAFGGSTITGSKNGVLAPSTDGTNGTPRAGKETRGRSFSVVYIMRIK